jgi:hypothetical protein
LFDGADIHVIRSPARAPTQTIMERWIDTCAANASTTS